MSPKISVLMPNYNCEKYIEQAIQSILKQEFQDFEFIIIDDASTDASWEIISKYAKIDTRIVPLRNEKNQKICKSLNRWLEIAKGKYIARMDSDDITALDRFKIQYEFLENNPEIWIVWANMEIMDEDGQVFSHRNYNYTDEMIRKKIFRYSPFCHASIMMQANLLKSLNWYNIFLHDAEDYDLYFRMWIFTKFANLDKYLYAMRVNKKSVTYKNTKRMELLTLYIRLKAVNEYGYKMSIFDKWYWTLQYISVFLIPAKLKIWLYNLLRNSK